MINRGVPLNDLSRQSTRDAEQLSAKASAVIESGIYFNGVETTKFRANMTDLLNGREFIPLANGTDALILALEALSLDRGSFVAMAPNAGGYGTIAALRAGLLPTYVDVDPMTAQMSADNLVSVLDLGVRVGAVIITHLYGQVGDITSISKICRDRGIPLIEDCAQSFGASVDGCNAGTFGDIATFSFYPTKNLGALGDAGGLASSDQQLIERVRSLAQYGWSNRYEVSFERGFNSRIDELQATFLNHNLEWVDQWNSRRREIVSRYNSELESGRRMIGSWDGSFVGHLAVMVTGSRSNDRETLRLNGIETSVHYPVLDPDQAAWSGQIGEFALPNARALAKSIVTLPCFPLMTDEEVDLVCSSLSMLG